MSKWRARNKSSTAATVAVLAQHYRKNLAEILPNSSVTAVAAPGDLISAGQNKEVSVVSGDALSLLALQDTLSDWRLLSRRVSREPYGIAVRQGDAALRDALNEALMEVWDDGRYQLIFDTWFGQGTLPYDGMVKFTMPTVPPDIMFVKLVANCCELFFVDFVRCQKLPQRRHLKNRNNDRPESRYSGNGHHHGGCNSVRFGW